MRLTKDMKDIILKHCYHLLDEEFGCSTSEITNRLRDSVAKFVSSREDIQERKRIYDEYKEYVYTTERVNLIYQMDERNMNLDIPMMFKMAVKKDISSYADEVFKVYEEDLDGHSLSIMNEFRKRTVANSNMFSRLSNVLKRVTTSKQLLKEIPECSVFFDEEDQFYIPDFSKR